MFETQNPLRYTFAENGFFEPHNKGIMNPTLRRGAVAVTRFASGESSTAQTLDVPTVDHVVPLACVGADTPSKMQWQTIAKAKAKDKVERMGCRGPARCRDQSGWPAQARPS